MERLDLSAPPPNPTMEAAVHIARYANIIPLVKDKVVLDLACGEGYGSALLKKAGAARVVGVDVSSSAIDKAVATFSASGAEYVVADVAQIEKLFASGTFDVVVSIETIEHVPDHEQFLRSIVEVAKRDAIIYITCPNDYWYYPNDEQKNPYHLRKYTFEQFADVTTRIIGSQVKWGLGTAIFGFGTAPLIQGDTFRPLYDSWIKASASGNSFVIPNSEFESTTTENCSYYVGMWNLQTELPLGSCSFPLSMNEYSRLYDMLAFDSVTDLRNALKHAQQEIENMKSQVKAFEIQISEYAHALQEKDKTLRWMGLRLSAAQSENKVIRENVGRLTHLCASLKQKNQDMEVGYWRYIRLTKLIPPSIRRVIVKLVRAVKGS